jgi:hypothetical protein
MTDHTDQRPALPTRRAFTTAGLLALAGCGGGGAGTGEPASDPGSIRTPSLASRSTGTTYPLSIYMPPAGSTRPQDLPVVYALDGETWFQTLVGLMQTTPVPAIVVAVHTAGLRARDFVPVNTCTSGGGGESRFLAFLRQELQPYVAAQVGGNPARQVLFGHSHGGSFVLHALFAEPPGGHGFQAYLASDASIGCMPSTVYGWEQAYAAAHATLPVRLHLSCATAGNHQVNLDYAAALKRRAYGGLMLADPAYAGTHLGIVPQALADGIGFALAGPR